LKNIAVLICIISERSDRKWIIHLVPMNIYSMY
jgi:hypothetical protein